MADEKELIKNRIQQSKLLLTKAESIANVECEPGIFLELFSVLQNLAIEIGNSIEFLYGGEHAAVMRIEEYCELIYQLYMQVQECEDGAARFAVKDKLPAIVELFLKIERLCNQAMEIDFSNQFQTVSNRPKYAYEIGRFSKIRLAKKTAIILQGPIKYEDDFTLETVKLYQKLYSDCEIIVSTWKEEEEKRQALEMAGANVVLSEKPEHSGLGNTAMQETTALAGIEKALELGCEYICKSRTDQRFYKPDLFANLNRLLDQFPLKLDTKAKGRIVAISMMTFSDRLYNVGDMFIYGYAEDVKRYFNCSLDTRDNGGITCSDALDFSKTRFGEIWFASHYIENLGFELKWTLEDSDKYRNELFIIVDTQMLDLYWPKYTNDEFRNRKYNGTVDIEVSFLDWFASATEKE